MYSMKIYEIQPRPNKKGCILMTDWFIIDSLIFLFILKSQLKATVTKDPLQNHENHEAQ